MPEIRKFMIDDHSRIRRTFDAYHKTPWSIDEAMNVSDTLRMHLTLEDEVVRPVVWAKVADDAAARDAAEHGQIEGLMAKIADMEPNDPSLTRSMQLLHQAVTRHFRTWERDILPKLADEDIYGLGGEAFRRRQELFNAGPPRTWRPMDKLANSGWGGGGKIANAGW